MIDLTEVNKSWAEPRKTTMPETKPTQPGQTNFQPWTLPGAYQKWSTGDPDYNAADDAWARNMTGPWWRAPQWGGGLVWNPDYGFQSRQNVKNWYGQYGGDLSKWGMTPNMETDWTKYAGLPGVTTGGGSAPAVGSGGYTMGGNWDDYFKNFVMPEPNIGVSAGMQYPQEWAQAGDIYGRFGYGDRTPDPWQWGYGSDWLTGMYDRGGMPTSTSPAYQMAKKQAEYDITDSIRQAAEQAGLGGTRWSTPLGRTAQDIAGRRMTELGVATTAQEMAAQEAAMARMMSGVPMLESLGAGTAGLSEAARSRAMQGAAGLAGLGGQYLGADQDIFGLASGLGGNLWGQGNTAAGNIFSNWGRLQGENNPFLQQAMALATGQGMPQQYTQSGLSQLLGGLGGAGMLAAGLGGQKGLCG